MKLILKWMVLNLPQFILICGFCLISLGCFLFSLPIGFVATGILLIILAIITYLMSD
ncbi:hypothetical protein COSHB9_01960 [Companilactobacillus alimentarius]